MMYDDRQRADIRARHGAYHAADTMRVRVTLTLTVARPAAWTAEYGDTYTADDVRRTVRASVRDAVVMDGIVAPAHLIIDATVAEN